MPPLDLDRLEEFLRFQSVSTDPACAGEVRRCAEWLAGQFQALGLTAAVHPTPGHPIVVARTRPDPRRRTLLIYGHYDVQPAENPADWISPPFAPTVRDGRIWARGASDDKGPVWALIQGLAAWLKRGEELPLNLVFLIEGEEEIGCPNLLGFVREHVPDLACDFLALSDTEIPAVDRPALTYATRGGMGVALLVTGPARDLHSGFFGGLVRNPAEALAVLLAGLYHPRTGAIDIPGFYDPVHEPADWEREILAHPPGDAAALLAESGSPESWGEAGRSAWERIWFRPTAEIMSLSGGYLGPGRKAIVPLTAQAKIHFRLTPNQTVAGAQACVERWVRARAPAGVKLDFQFWKTGEPFLIDPRGTAAMAARRALRRTFGREAALIRSGGSIGILPELQRLLRVDPLLLGLHLPDARLHSPNENFHLDLYRAGTELLPHLIRELAGLGAKGSVAAARPR